MHNSHNTRPKTASYTSWVVVLSAALFFFYEFIQLNIPNSLNLHLMRDFNITASELGELSQFYFISNLLFLFVAGILLDRYSVRKIVLFALGVCVVATFFFSQTESLLISSICRFASGIGSAFCFLSTVRLASRWFPPQRMALVVGVIVMMAMVGGMVAQTPLTALIETFGWRLAVAIDAALGLVIWAIIAVFVRDYPAEETQTSIDAAEFDNAVSFWNGLYHSYLNRQNWLGGIYTSLMNLSIFLIGAIFGIAYLVQVHGFTANDASHVTSALFLGVVIGSPAAGWISDHLRRRRQPMIIGALLSLATIMVIMFLPAPSKIEFIGLFLLLGFFTSTQVISYPMVAESNSKNLTATATSVISFCAIGGGAVFQPIFGKILDATGTAQIVMGAPSYSPEAYFNAMLIIPVAIVVALLAVLGMKETYKEDCP